MVTGFASGTHVYAAGFILIVGFDKMFNVFIRTLRQRIIPRQDLGKTTELIVMLNNLSQPLAGLCVTAFAALGAPWIIVVLTAVAAVMGGVAAELWRRRAQPVAG